MIKITDRLFSFPPHLVTPWEQVSSIEGKSFSENETIVIFHMTTGLSIELPALPKDKVKAIFEAYELYHDQRALIKVRIRNTLTEPSAGLPGANIIPAPLSSNTTPPVMGVAIPLSMFHEVSPLSSASLSQLAQNLRHNPEMKDLPNLPQSLLEKIARTARDLFNEDSSFELPTPHAGCCCMHCQLARAAQCGLEQAGENVSEEDLRFSRWHIHPLSLDHFLVVSTENPSECFDVRLKPHVECSCKENGCAHIDAVLRS